MASSYIPWDCSPGLRAPWRTIPVRELALKTRKSLAAQELRRSQSRQRGRINRQTGTVSGDLANNGPFFAATPFGNRTSGDFRVAKNSPQSGIAQEAKPPSPRNNQLEKDHPRRPRKRSPSLGIVSSV